MDDLTPAQVRVLRFLAKTKYWVNLKEIELFKGLDKDDLVVLPSLLKAQLCYYRTFSSPIGCVKITPAGLALLVELKERGRDSRST